MKIYFCPFRSHAFSYSNKFSLYCLYLYIKPIVSKFQQFCTYFDFNFFSEIFLNYARYKKTLAQKNKSLPIY